MSGKNIDVGAVRFGRNGEVPHSDVVIDILQQRK